MWLHADSKDTVRYGWENASLYYRHLKEGGTLAALPQGTLRLDAEEISHVDMVVGLARFYGFDLQELLDLAGAGQHSRRVRRKMDEMMTPKWRDHTEVRTILTTHRLLFAIGQWNSLWHEHIMEIDGNVSDLEFRIRYSGNNDIMLYGSSAPLFAVALAWLSYGPRGLALPALAAIAAEIGS